MPISDLELAELKSRTANAIRTQSSLANAEGHIQDVKDRIGGGAREQRDDESPIGYLYSLILLAEIMPAASDSDAVRVAHRDRFIKESVLKGKFVMNVARTTEELTEQLNEDLKEAEEAPQVSEVIAEQSEEAQVKVADQPEKHHKGKKDKKKS
jgi:hypothetical protein